MHSPISRNTVVSANTMVPTDHGSDGGTPLVTRRRLLQAAAALGGAAALSSTVWPHLEAAEPEQTDLADDFDRYTSATESVVATSGLSVWTPTGSVERGERLSIRASSRFSVLDLSIHRIGGPNEAVWECSAAAVTYGDGTPPVGSVDVAMVVADWPTGLYLIRATPSGAQSGSDDFDLGIVAFHPFVVTDLHSPATITVQVPFATYQAYNAWAPAGDPRRSLYDFNSPGGRAKAVSIDRPYDVFDGAGFLFYGDQQLASWLRAEGIEVNYTSSWDTHHRPELLDGTRLFLSNFHDEYWSAQMRDHLEQRVASGMNAVFLGANNLYWQVDIDDSTLACDKVKGGAQGTFKSIGRPESDLLGSLFESYRHPYRLAAADWVVTQADHWIYGGTGLADGDVIERLVGYEWDRVPGDQPAQGVTIVGSSPINDRHHHHATIVERNGQGTVFNAGTNYWPRMLTGGGGWPRNDAVQQITRNLIDALS